MNLIIDGVTIEGATLGRPELMIATRVIQDEQGNVTGTVPVEDVMVWLPLMLTCRITWEGPKDVILREPWSDEKWMLTNARTKDGGSLRYEHAFRATN